MKTTKTTKTAVRAIALVCAALLMSCILLMFTGCAPDESIEPESTPVISEESDYVIIRLPNDTIVEGYADYIYSYTNGSVKITIDGVEYQTHWENVVRIKSSK